MAPISVDSAFIILGQNLSHQASAIQTRKCRHALLLATLTLTRIAKLCPKIIILIFAIFAI